MKQYNRFLLALIMLMIIITSSSAQNKGKETVYDDTVQVRVVYKASMDVTEDFKDKTKYCLDIGKTSAAFYDYAILMYDILDSYPVYSDEYESMRDELSTKYGSKWYGQLRCMVNVPDNAIYTFINSIGLHTLKYEEPIPHIEWQLDDSVKTICEYTCHKAVGRLYGRTWHVWYAEDIPLFYGPYILSGLPGVILAAWEEEHHFEFEAECIESLKGSIVVEPHMRGGLAQECTRKQFLKLRNDNDGFTISEKAQQAFGNLEGTGGKKPITLDQNGNDVSDKVFERYYFDKE